MSANSISNLGSNAGANSRAIGNVSTTAGAELLRVNFLRTLNTGTVTIENATLNSTIAGDVLGAPNGIATLGPTGIIPSEQTGGTVPVSTTDNDNTSLGVGALASVITADNNVAFGYNAGNAATSATGCTYVGHGAGSSNNSTGGIFIGYNAGVGYVSGSDNIIIGRETTGGAANTRCISIGSATSHANGVTDSLCISTNGGGTTVSNAVILRGGTCSLIGNTTTGWSVSHRTTTPGLTSTGAIKYDGYYGANANDGTYSPLGALGNGYGSGVTDRLRYICGTVTAAGAISGVDMGVTVTRQLAGTYLIEFTVPFAVSAIYASSCVFGASVATSAVVWFFTVDDMTIHIRDGSGNNVDSQFFFMAIGQ